MIFAPLIAHTAAFVVVSSSAKNAATYGDHVKSINRVGAPWCCISASHWNVSSSSGTCFRKWCARL